MATSANFLHVVQRSPRDFNRLFDMWWNVRAPPNKTGGFHWEFVTVAGTNSALHVHTSSVCNNDTRNSFIFFDTAATVTSLSLSRFANVTAPSMVHVDELHDLGAVDAVGQAFFLEEVAEQLPLDLLSAAQRVGVLGCRRLLVPVVHGALAPLLLVVLHCRRVVLGGGVLVLIRVAIAHRVAGRTLAPDTCRTGAAAAVPTTAWGIAAPAAATDAPVAAAVPTTVWHISALGKHRRPKASRGRLKGWRRSETSANARKGLPEGGDTGTKKKQMRG